MVRFLTLASLTSSPKHPEPFFDVYVWNQSFRQMNGAPQGLGVCRHASAQVIQAGMQRALWISGNDKLTSYMDKPTMTPAGLYGFISGMKPCLQLTVPGSLPQPDWAVAVQPSNSTINGLADHLASCQYKPFGRLPFLTKGKPWMLEYRERLLKGL